MMEGQKGKVLHWSRSILVDLTFCFPWRKIQESVPTASFKMIFSFGFSTILVVELFKGNGQRIGDIFFASISETKTTPPFPCATFATGGALEKGPLFIPSL